MLIEKEKLFIDNKIKLAAQFWLIELQVEPLKIYPAVQFKHVVALLQ